MFSKRFSITRYIYVYTKFFNTRRCARKRTWPTFPDECATGYSTSCAIWQTVKSCHRIIWRCNAKLRPITLYAGRTQLFGSGATWTATHMTERYLGTSSSRLRRPWWPSNTASRPSSIPVTSITITKSRWLNGANACNSTRYLFFFHIFLENDFS